MPTRRGFLSSMFLAPLLAKLPVATSHHPDPAPPTPKLDHVSIFTQMDGPNSAQFTAPVDSFQCGQRVTLSFNGVTNFDGIVDSIMRVPDEKTEHVSCKDWASFARHMSDQTVQRLMRDMRARTIDFRY
jgi:hypothetical protein